MTSKKEGLVDVQVRMDNLVEDHKSITEEIESMMAIKNAKIEQIEANFSAKKDKLETMQNMIMAELRVLAEQVPQKETKTRYKVDLLSGSIVIKKPTQTLVADKEKLIEWAKKAAMLEYIDEKVIESFKWKDFKGDVEIIDGKPVNKYTGEVMTDCIVVEEVPEKVVIK